MIHGIPYCYPQLPEWIVDPSLLIPACLTNLMTRIDTYARQRVVSTFHTWYKTLPPETAQKHRHELIHNFDAKELACEDSEIDALILKSKSFLRTGNFLVYCINTTYQNHHPRHFAPFLNNGADVVVWNANLAGLTPKNYSRDLTFVLKALRKQNPEQSIAVMGHCMVTDPIISAVSSINDSNIHLIVDRGYGDATSLATALTPLSRIPLIQRILREDCDCQGIEKIKDIGGKILFIFAGTGDQIMDYGWGKNFTQDLAKKRKHHFDAIVLKGGDHWSAWDYPTYSRVLKFLFEVRVTQKEPFELNTYDHPDATSPSYLKRKYVQCALKCKATFMKL